MAQVSILLCAAMLAHGISEVRDGPARVTLRTERMTLALDKERKGAVVSLVDAATGQEFIAPQAAPDLFFLALSDPGDISGKLLWVGSGSAESVTWSVEARGATKLARMVFSGLGGRRLRAECTVSAAEGDDAALWRITVSGDEHLMLEDVGYPVLSLRTPLADGTDQSAFVAGLTKGGVYRAPSRWPAGSTIYARQPGGLAAQFACYYGPRAGLYSATRDTKGYPKVLQVRRTESGLEWVWRRQCCHNLSTAFEPGYEVALTTFGSPDAGRLTDWRDAADVYKAWALKQPWCARPLARRDDLPAWLLEGPAMVRFDRGWLSRPERIEQWLRDYYQARFPQGPLIVAFWGWERVAPWISPKYFPPHPSEEGLRKCVESVRGVGGHPFFWPSGYHWAATFGKRPDGTFDWDDRADFEKTGLPHAIRNRDGAPWSWDPPWLNGGTNYALCRGDPWTRRWLDDIAAELTKRGADLIQVDQVVGGGAPGEGRCYSSQHGHPPGPGVWDSEAFGEQLRTMREACRRVNPDIVLGFEEPQELFIQRVGIQDYRDWEMPWAPPEPQERASVFGYLYHEFVPCFQSVPRPDDRLMTAYCLVNGEIPHVAPHWPVEPSPALRNGGFEDWTDGAPEGWEQVRGYRGQLYAGRSSPDETVKHTGNRSLRLENDGADDIGQVSQNVAVGPGALQAGRTYRLSLWSLAPELSRANNVIVGAFDPDWKALGSWSIPLVHGNEWHRGEVAFSIPQGAVRLRIMLHVMGPAKVWMDDVGLEEQDADGARRTVMLAGLPADHELALQWVRLFRGEGRPYLLLGRMLHPPPLTGAMGSGSTAAERPAILHNAYRAPDGTEAVIALNATDEPQECVLTWRGGDRALSFRPWEAKLIR